MSDEDNQSSGLGFLLALGGAAAAIYTAFKVFTKEETQSIELKNIATSVGDEVSILIPAHFEDAILTIEGAKAQLNLINFE